MIQPRFLSTFLQYMPINNKQIYSYQTQSNFLSGVKLSVHQSLFLYPANSKKND